MDACTFTWNNINIIDIGHLISCAFQKLVYLMFWPAELKLHTVTVVTIKWAGATFTVKSLISRK